jgi:ornithine cyclodeaminase/alanine dehydrogenase-like protein (mu-crystallin family)
VNRSEPFGAAVSAAPPPWIGAEAIIGLLPIGECIDTVESALLGGLDPSADPPRGAVDTSAGQLLVMPSEYGGRVGVKIVSVAPGNPTRGLARIQAVYVLADSDTLTPMALLEGSAITSLRTPAVSALAARHLAAPEARTLVVFGTGPQARGHIAAMAEVRPLREVIVVGRNTERAKALVDEVRATGLDAMVGEPDSVRRAHIVVCATTSTSPLFDGTFVPPGCCVVAVGSHEATVRELDACLMGRSQVVVEDIGVAMREAGDVVLAVREGALSGDSLIGLTDLVRGGMDLDPSRPRVFKSVGMSWQDLVVATELNARYLRRDTEGL